MARVVKLSEFAPYVDELHENIREAARRGLRNAALRGVQTIVAVIIPSRSPEPVDRGVYRAGWRAEQIDANTFSINNPEKHAAIIEHGARAANIKVGRAMIAALTEWVLRKGIANVEDATQVAWAIAIAATRNGIFGGGMRILAELNEVWLPRIVDEEVRYEISRAPR